MQYNIIVSVTELGLIIKLIVKAHSVMHTASQQTTIATIGHRRLNTVYYSETLLPYSIIGVGDCSAIGLHASGIML